MWAASTLAAHTVHRVGRTIRGPLLVGDVDVQLDRDVAGDAVLLDQDVILRGLDHVLDLLEDVTFHDDEACRVVSNVRVLGESETDAFKARDIGALAEELVHVRVVAVVRGKIVDPLVDLAEQVLIPGQPHFLGLLHPANVAASSGYGEPRQS